MQFGTLKDFKGNSIPLNTAIDLDTLFYTPSEVTKIETIEFKLLCGKFYIVTFYKIKKSPQKRAWN